MSPNDLRTKPSNELTFFVYDNLRASQDHVGGNVYYFDTLDEAIREFDVLPSGWTTALGGSINGTQEVDFVQRREGEAVLITDYQKMNFWKDSPTVQRTINRIVSRMEIEWMVDNSILQGTSILIPYYRHLPEPNDYYDDKTIAPKIPDKSFTAIDEAFIKGEGWVPLDWLVKESKNYGYSDPHCPAVMQFSILYKSDNGKAGYADIKPAEFKALIKRYETRDLTARIEEKVNNFDTLNINPKQSAVRQNQER